MLRRLSIALVLAFLAWLPASAQDAQTTAPGAEPLDYETALRELRALAARGNPRTQNRLAIMYRRGEGVPQDDAEAVIWFRRAAEQGYTKAQYNLAGMYRRGLGVARDHTEAEVWFRKAALQGHARAQYNLAVMYLKGDGLPQDNAQALAWFEKAAAQGHGGAAKALGLIRSKGPAKKEKAPMVVTKAPPAPVPAPPRPTQAAPPTPIPTPLAPGDIRVQLGALKGEARAIQEAGRLNQVHGSVLGKLTVAPVRADLGERGIFYRLRTGPLADRAAAKALCNEFAALKQGCIVVRP